MPDANANGEEQSGLDQTQEAFEKFNGGEIDIKEFGKVSGVTPDKPYTLHRPGKTIWQFVPFYETVLLRLFPTFDERLFTVFHGFEPTQENTNQVIDLIDTGRIRPLFTDPPTQVEGFLEVRDPSPDEEIIHSFYEEVLRYDPSLFIPGNALALRRLEEEAPQKMEEYWNEISPKIGLDVSFDKRNDDDIDAYTMDIIEAEAYTLLRAFGYHGVARNCVEYIEWHGPMKSPIQTAGIFLLEPMLDPYVEQYPIPLSIDESLDSRLANRRFDELTNEIGVSIDHLSNTTFPTEVGQFLFEERMPRLEKKNAALTLYDEYSTHDLHKYLKSLTEGVENWDEKDIYENVREIDMICDQIADEKEKIISRKEKAESSIRIGVGITGVGLGMNLSPVAGGAVGILSTLGVNLLDDELDMAAEKVASFGKPRHLVNLVAAENELEKPLLSSENDT